MKKGMGRLAVALVCAAGGVNAATITRDVVVYGSSPAGLTAAIQAKRMGKSVIVVTPDNRIGGLTTGGLGATDIGRKDAFGGLALQFYRDIAAYYAKPENWTWQKREAFGFKEQGSQSTKESMWVFEPHAALDVLKGWMAREGVEVVCDAWLDREPGGVTKVDGRLVSFRTLTGRTALKPSGNTYVGKMFVDATYEGDLMAAVGVSYTVGREPNAQYGETLSGTQVRHAKYHQFCRGVDPYVVKGDKSSGLLPCIESQTIEPDGTGDRRVQAYCYRMCLTDVPENRIPFKKPADYNEKNYELLLRNFEAGERGMPWINSRMPNRKTDTNNRTAFSTDFIGQNWNWPDASYAEREQMAQAHLAFQKGLMWTLANHPRVPEKIRTEVARWGTCKDEFQDGQGDGWQYQLYVREARRMVSSYVMTEANCLKRAVAPHPVALAAYQMDSHNVRRYVTAKGDVQNEGDVEVGVSKGPFGIDYASIVPKKDECANLFVPVCLSASHMAFGSIRMEPVFFALGQASGTAAAQAIDAGCAVQDLPYAPLAARLRADGQVLDPRR